MSNRRSVYALTVIKEAILTTEESGQHEILRKILAEVSRVVIGKNEIKELLLIALLSQGHALIEGLPGTAKTLLARSFAQAIGGRFKRVQGTPDMLPADILGFYHYRPDGSATFMPGPIFANVILADELNRTTPRTQAALLEAMQEQQVTIERETHPLEKPFVVIASQMPHGAMGTAPMTEVQLDRFMFRIWSGFPSTEEEKYILKNIDRITEAQIVPVATLGDIIQLQEAVKNVHVADSISGYIIDVLDRLRHHPDLLIGPSARGSIALFLGARALAFTQGRDFVVPDDVKRLLIPALSHRLQISSEAEMDKVTPESIINQVANEVPVPKGEAVGQDGSTCESAVETTARLAVASDEPPLKVDKAQPETAAEVEHPSLKAEDTLVEAEEIRARAEEPSRITTMNWYWILLLCILVLGAVMISVGLLSFR